VWSERLQCFFNGLECKVRHDVGPSDPMDARAWVADIDQACSAVAGGSQGMAQEKRPPDNIAPVDGKPPTARKPSRMEEILRIIEEYASSQRELLKALRKKLFH
jgi:hypothetical protein